MLPTLGLPERPRGLGAIAGCHCFVAVQVPEKSWSVPPMSNVQEAVPSIRLGGVPEIVPLCVHMSPELEVPELEVVLPFTCPLTVPEKERSKTMPWLLVQVSCPSHKIVKSEPFWLTVIVP